MKFVIFYTILGVLGFSCSGAPSNSVLNQKTAEAPTTQKNEEPVSELAQVQAPVIDTLEMSNFLALSRLMHDDKWGKALLVLEDARTKRNPSFNNQQENYKVLRRFFYVVDSLSQHVAAPDSLEFKIINSQYEVCHLTNFFIGEVCYITEIPYNRLRRFITRFKDSNLLDDAALSLIINENCYEAELEGHDVDLELQKLRRFLKKYPNTDCMETYDRQVVYLSTHSFKPEAFKKRAIKNFLEKYPDAPDKETFIYELKQIESDGYY